MQAMQARILELLMTNSGLTYAELIKEIGPDAEGESYIINESGEIIISNASKEFAQAMIKLINSKVLKAKTCYEVDEDELFKQAELLPRGFAFKPIKFSRRT